MLDLVELNFFIDIVNSDTSPVRIVLTHTPIHRWVEERGAKHPWWGVMVGHNAHTIILANIAFCGSR